MFLLHIHSHLLYLLLDCLSISRLSLLMLYPLILSCLFYFGEYFWIFEEKKGENSCLHKWEKYYLFYIASPPPTFLGGLVLGYFFFCKKNKDV